MKEATYQKDLIKKLKLLFPGCLILKNDPKQIQGIPDLTIFYKDKWAMLEVKATSISKFRPNQHYYLEKLKTMSFAALINPDNEKDILDALQRSFGISRKTRILKSK